MLFRSAVDQLVTVGKQIGVEVYTEDGNKNPVEIASNGIKYAKQKGFDLVIVDTAGRLAVDEQMMNEIASLKEALQPHEILFVVDSMTGQDAVNVATSFDEQVSIDGVILTKLDGDTRGGAALSIRAVTGKPILYAGMGEKLSDLEQFHPDRMASRILGMGDVLSLIEKAEAEIDKDAAIELSKKVKKAAFDFNDYLTSMEQMKKLGGLTSILGMMPGINSSQMSQLEGAIDDKKLAHIEAIILSMTPAERENPKLLNPSRKHRIAAGAGLDIAEVNRFIKQFEQSKKMMKQMPNMMGKGRRGRRFPF